jgi:hypothetical protein
MGGILSGRYPSGSRRKSRPIKEHSLFLDARELVREGVVRGCSRQAGAIETLVSGPHLRPISGRYLVICDDTLPLWQQGVVRHRMKLGKLRLDFTPRGSQPVNQEIELVAGMTRLDVVHWGFRCPKCLRFARKLFLPPSRVHFLCRRCHGLRYISQRKLNAWALAQDAAWDHNAWRLGLPSARLYHKIQTAGLASLGYVRQ